MKTKNLNASRMLLFAGLCLATACNNSGSNATTNMADSVTAKTDTVVHDIKQDAQNVAGDIKNAVSGNRDSNFVVKATIANMEELQVLQAALDEGSDIGLKDHAKMMIADHKKLGEKVKEYAAKKGYILPATDHDKGYDDVSQLDNNNNKGAAWDKAWVAKMISGHQDAISLFEDNQNNVKDPALKTLITDALPTLHAHLDMMTELQAKLGK